MILIGEKLNSSIPSSYEAMLAGDRNRLAELVRMQSRADFLDLNAARCPNEEEMLAGLIAVVAENSTCGIMLDSPDISVLCRAARAASGRKLIFNSVTASTDVSKLLPVAIRENAGIVVMPMKKRVPKTAAERVETAMEIVSRLDGIPQDNIYIDAVTEALASGDDAAVVTLQTISDLKKALPAAHVICGVSNISFGLPGRSSINAAFLAMAVSRGLDAAILDTASEQVMSSLYAACALCGLDEYCMNYIDYKRG